MIRDSRLAPSRNDNHKLNIQDELNTSVKKVVSNEELLNWLKESFSCVSVCLHHLLHLLNND